MLYGAFGMEGADELPLIEDAEEASAELLRLCDLAKGRKMLSSEQEVGQASVNGGIGGAFEVFRAGAERLQEAS